MYKFHVAQKKLCLCFYNFLFSLRVGICVLAASAGLIMVAYSGTVQWLAIFGVVITSFASGLGEASYLQYSSFYDK